jgi:two-component system phosphate regulon sensor histidine kinase PhoR
MPSLLLKLLWMIFGAGVGHALGLQFQFESLGLWLGLGVMAVLLSIQHLRQVSRFFHWLRNAATQDAPRMEGIWGEAAYQVQKALREREHQIQVEQHQLQQFLSAIQASPNGVLLIDGQDLIEWFNASAADHYGLNPHIDLRQNIAFLVRQPDFSHFLKQATYASNGRGFLVVQVFPYGEGRRMLLSSDVTSLEQGERMRSDFVANVSHEIRTPLTVLNGFIETLQSLPVTEDEKHRFLGLMQQQAQRMLVLVNDLLTLAKLEGSPPPPTDQWVPIDQLFHALRAEAEGLSAGRHTFTFSETEVEVAGVEQELHSAISNLLSNAIRYTPAGGRIHVLAHVTEAGLLELCIKDNGPGIPQEHLSRLTERFYRVDSSRSRETGGTGLGLSIVKHVVIRHGGELRIESQNGQGSLFCVVLPAGRVRSAA